MQATRTFRLICDKLVSYFDFFLYKLSVLPDNNLPPDEEYLLYIGFRLPARITRIGDRTTFVKKVLIIQKEGFFKEFYSSSSFDHIITFRNEWHLLRIVGTFKKESVYLIHAFEPKTKYAALIIRNYIEKFVVIVDFQDVYVNYYGINSPVYWMRKDIPYERYCLENADGIISSSMEVLPARKKFAIKSNPPTLFFPLYCNENDFIRTNRKPDNEIRLVYAGGISSINEKQTDSQITNYYNLIKSLNQQNIYFDIFPSPYVSTNVIDEYKELEKEFSCFTIKECVTSKELSLRLSEYDFGIIPFFLNKDWKSTPKLKYSISLKLFNFLESGIPVILSSDIYFQSSIIDRYNMGIVLNSSAELTTLRSKIEMYSYNDLKENVIRGREHLSIEKNIGRLFTFYEDLKLGKKSK